MDKRTRPYKLFVVGNNATEEYLQETTSRQQKALLVGIAAMIASATEKSKPKPKTKPAVSVDRFLDDLCDTAGDWVLCKPYDNRWDYQARNVLGNIKGVTPTDAQLVGEYLASGGWKGEKPTLGLVIKFLPDLIAKARATRREISTNVPDNVV
jgi:hypothetical protein